MNKIISMQEAIAKINDGMTIMIGGFMAAGTPNAMMKELQFYINSLKSIT